MDKHARQAPENAQLSAPLHSATSLTAEEMQLVKSQQQVRARQFAQQQSQVSISMLSGRESFRLMTDVAFACRHSVLHVLSCLHVAAHAVMVVC